MNPTAQTSGAAPTPITIFEAFNAYIDSMSLKGAIELDLFTIIAEGAVTTAAIAERAKASERGIRTLCDFLTIRGFLTKSGSEYALAPASAIFLNKKSPAYLGAAAFFLLHETHMRNFSDVAAVVRKGGAVNQLANIAPDNPIWVEFARSMVGLAGPAAEELAATVARPGEKN